MEVEFNRSRHSIGKGPTNRYRIGKFSSHDIAHIHSGHNLTFTSASNFHIRILAKTLCGERYIGSIKCVPFQEAMNNMYARSTIVRSKNHEDDEMDIVTDFVKDNLLSDSDVGKGGLFMLCRDSNGRTTQFILPHAEKSLTHKMNFSGERGGGYELLFTIKKHDMMEHILPKTMWHNFRKELSLLESRDFIHYNSEGHGPLPNPNIVHNTEKIQSQDHEVSSLDFSIPTTDNHVEVLIDGLETFKRYYEIMMQAQHSINIVGWEINLTFGLVVAHQSKQEPPRFYDPSSRWITLEDVLVSKAKNGVKVKIIVWRHELLSYINRYLYLGEVTIESEVSKLEKRCKKLGLVLKVFHSHNAVNNSPYANPFGNTDADIMIIIARNPKGLVSSHHEKLVLIDPECPKHTYAFTGGFDIARGRFDQPLHLVPRPERKKKSQPIKDEARYTGRNVQPVSRKIRFLWHDIQVLLKGPVTRLLYLHFAQRWSHSFTHNPNSTKSLTLPPQRHDYCYKHNPVKLKGNFTNCVVRLERTWKSVFDLNYLFEDYCRMLKSAKKFLYIEHQYPFQNFSLTYYMCEALKSNPELKVIIVTPIKTDLPTGIVGEFFNWSQDHIIDHLQLIYQTAPDRVGIYGLASQDSEDRRMIKSIYVHTKMVIIDDQWVLTGSTNMDNVSFFYSSELSVEIHHPSVARETRKRLFREHLGKFYKNEFDDDFNQCFDAFKNIASMNIKTLKENNILSGRPVSLAPMEDYNFIKKKVTYPTKFRKAITKMGLSPEDVIQVLGDGVDNVMSFVKQKSKL